MQELYPEPQPAGLDVYDDLDLGSLAPPGRPYVICNMISTADGQGRVGDNTEELGGTADAKLFAAIRGQVDAVAAGTGTLRAEHYRALARDPERRKWRLARGLRERPYLVTVSRSGKLPLDEPVFQDEASDVLAFTPAAPSAEAVPASVTCINETDPLAILKTLHERFDVRSVVLEGGPTLNTPFFNACLVDELFLTLAPMLIGGASQFSIIKGALDREHPLLLKSAVLDDADHLFLRYAVQ